VGVDPSDLDAVLADAFAGGGPLDAQTLNMACFWLSRRLDDLDFTTAEAAPLARTLLRIVGRVIIDTGTPGADPGTWENTEGMVLQWIAEALEPLGYVPKPIPGRGRSELVPPSAEWDAG
jgi:hypothetical protein